MDEGKEVREKMLTLVGFFLTATGDETSAAPADSRPVMKPGFTLYFFFLSITRVSTPSRTPSRTPNPLFFFFF